MAASSLKRITHALDDASLGVRPWLAVERAEASWYWLDRVASNRHHRFLDQFISRVEKHPFGFYRNGWGHPERLVTCFQDMQDMLAAGLPLSDVEVPEATVKHHARDPSLTEVHFPTTFWRSEWLPAESQTACAQLVMPHHPRPDVPVLLLLPGTGEQWYRRRREGIALPLAQEGVATLILEGPFYGQRRPAHQFGSKLRHVSDLPMLGAATIAEAQSLLVWLRRHVTTGPLVVGGTSMGGLHAAMTASLIDMPVGIASWLGPPSATPPFTSGALGGCTEWSILEDDVARSGIDAVCRNAPWRLEGAYEECAEGGRAQRLMVEFLNVSDISHFPRPRAPSAARFFVAKDDMYLPPRSVAPHWDTLTRRWGTPPVEWVDGGHVAATLFKRRQFRDAVCSIARHLRGLR